MMAPRLAAGRQKPGEAVMPHATLVLAGGPPRSLSLIASKADRGPLDGRSKAASPFMAEADTSGFSARRGFGLLDQPYLLLSMTSLFWAINTVIEAA